MSERNSRHATEIIKNLIVGGISDLADILDLHVDVLVPLDRLPSDIWERGFRGEILYCPITDYSTLPDDVLDRLVHDIAAYLEHGKRVGMFCLGGHGRTGYVAACVLAALGVEEPVVYLREHYDRKAVETGEQEKAVARYAAEIAAKPDYSAPKTWQGRNMDDNLGEKLCETSVFVFCKSGYMRSAAVHELCVTWFNDISALAGYFRHKVLCVFGARLLGLPDGDNELKIADVLEYKAGNESEASICEILRRLDDILALSPETPYHTSQQLERFVESYNLVLESMQMLEWAGRVDLLYGASELQAFERGGLGDYGGLSGKVDDILATFKPHIPYAELDFRDENEEDL